MAERLSRPVDSEGCRPWWGQGRRDSHSWPCPVQAPAQHLCKTMARRSGAWHRRDAGLARRWRAPIPQDCSVRVAPRIPLRLRTTDHWRQGLTGACPLRGSAVCPCVLRAVTIEHGMDGAFARQAYVTGQPAQEDSLIYGRPSGACYAGADDHALDLAGQLVGVARGPARAVAEGLEPCSL